MHIDPAAISVVLNNRIRTDAQMPWTEVQQASDIRSPQRSPPRPRCSSRPHACIRPPFYPSPTNLTSQQILKVADQILEHEKVK